MSTIPQTVRRVKAKKGEGTRPRKVGVFEKQVRVTKPTYQALAQERARILKEDGAYLPFAEIVERAWKVYKESMRRPK